MINFKKLVIITTEKISNEAHDRELTSGMNLFSNFGYLFFIKRLNGTSLSVFCLDPNFEVEIKYSKNNIDTKCSLCESVGTLCMHEVASLLKFNEAILKDKLPKDIEKKS